MAFDELTTLVPLLKQNGVQSFKMDEDGAITIEFFPPFFTNSEVKAKTLVEMERDNLPPSAGRNDARLWGKNGPPQFPGVKDD